ncbi:MAG: sigma-70 family RNA polymerase sigma factor [Elusimicrobia bacterium]|nr:sigma-70 family RNA polymerase sigma factor [Elusimicrobiota bacterium]MDE2236909.1 sigma-70 family RNA polymerase sigma factor [Elusimicrobiota bacterium]MDE2426435.1 sigma-70 family RNA polymerase sigma factor [Elusimicrobiota bacterium]
MIERFVRDYSDKAYQAAYHLCGDVEQAKELVQEAFVKLMRTWERYDQEQPLENWFLTIMRNIHVDGLRRCERRRSVSLDAPVPWLEEGSSFADCLQDSALPPLLERLERQEEGRLVRQALARLSPEHRSVMTLVDLEGLDYGRVAEVLDCPVGTVRSRLSRARAALKREVLALDAAGVKR